MFFVPAKLAVTMYIARPRCRVSQCIDDTQVAHEGLLTTSRNVQKSHASSTVKRREERQRVKTRGFGSPDSSAKEKRELHISHEVRKLDPKYLSKGKDQWGVLLPYHILMILAVPLTSIWHLQDMTRAGANRRD